MKQYQDYIHLSKYSRYRDDLKRRETWEETCWRYVHFFSEKFDLTADVESMLFDGIYKMKAMPSMRAMMTAGKAAKRDNMAIFNPVTGDTLVLTKEYGYVPIKDLEGKKCHVLNVNGEWSDASFTGYGCQDIYEVTVRKNSNTIHSIRCTGNHRWYTSSGEVKPTSELISGRHGDKLPYSSWKRPIVDDIDYNLGVVHGLIFGDGTKQFVQERLNGYMIRLCSDAKELIPLFEQIGDDNITITHPPSFDGDPVIQMFVNFARTHDLKALPKDETDSYMIGFIRGWLAADGYVGKNSQVCLCINEDYLDWFYTNSARYGYVVQATHELPHETNFGKRKKRGFNVVIDRSSLDYDDFIISRKRENFRPLESRFCVVSVEKLDIREEVYCAEVPNTNTFVLERGLVTGNCAAAAVNSPRVFDEAFYILMCGTGFGFSVQRRYIDQLPTINDEMYDSETVIVVEDSKIGWARALKELIAMLYTGNIPKWDLSKVRPAGARLKTFGGRACLTGDTILYKDRKKSRGYNEITVKDLYDMERSQGKWEHKPNHFGDVKLRSLDEETGQFFRNKVITVVDNGIAPVYQIVTENGYRIKATGNHRFMRETGEYDFVDNFNVDDMIAVNGVPEQKTGICIDCGKPISRRALRCKSCFDIHQTKKDALPTSARQRKRCCDYVADHCEICGLLESESDKRFERHHIDENPENNDHANLLYLCPKCHQQLHARQRTFPGPYSHKYLSYDKIISIEYVGEEQVYDLQMQGPNHNFIANGLVSHNSGPQPLNRLFEYTVRLFKSAVGRQLTSIECHDLMCMIAKTVIVGSVRRSACISFSNLSDDRMRRAKSGEWYFSNPERSLANNSVMYTCKPDTTSFLTEMLSMYMSKSGERGMCNQEALQAKAKSCGRKHDGLYLLNPCVTGDTRILTTDGYIPIRELVDKNVQVWNGDQFSRVKPFSTGINELMSISFSNGATMRVTPYHKFILPDDTRIEAKDMEIGTKLKKFDMPIVNSVNDPVIDAYSQGFYSGDGDTDRDRSKVYFTKYACMQRLVGDFIHTNPNYSNWVHGNMMDKSFVPINASMVFKQNWLAGLLDSDGHITKNPNSIGLVISSIDYDFLNDVRLMLSTMGVQSTVTHEHPSMNKEMPDGKGGSKTYFCQSSYRLLINASDTKTLIKNGLRCNRLDLTKCDPDRDARRFITVTSVEYLGYSEETFCATEPLNNLLTFEGIVTGNCGEAILRDTGGLCNLSEIVVRPDDTIEDLKEKAVLATIYGTLQSSMTDFRYLRKVWADNAKEDVLLGVSLTGVMDHPVMSGYRDWIGMQQDGEFPELSQWLAELKEVVQTTNIEWAEKLGCPPAKQLTLVKPSGCATLETEIKTTSGNKSFHTIFSDNGFDPYTMNAGQWAEPTVDTFVYDKNNDVKKVTKLFCNGIADVYDIEDEQGIIHSFTGNHELETNNGFKRVDELTTDDEIISW